MPAIPESTRSSIVLRLLDHAERNWPQLAKVQARYHGSFAYITGVLPGGQQIPLFRLRYGGSAHSFGFAIYSAARDRYEDALLLTGLPIGSPQEALDTACTVHLAGLGHEPGNGPPTNLRCHPLSQRGPPHAAPEVAIPQQYAGRAGEHERIGGTGSEGREMVSQRRTDHIGHDHYAPTCHRLGRAKHISATRQLGKRALNPHGPLLDIDVAAAQRGQLTPAQTAENREQHEGAVLGADRIGQDVDLGNRQDRTLG